MKATLCAAVLLAFPTIGHDDPKASQRMPLTVHEWGTFTFVQGSDGTTLEGLRHDDWDLPSFVARRTRAARSENRTKMETPVTYFYTPREQDVRVSVEFPSGLFTHWYPDVRAFAPKLADESGEAPKLEGGVLEWGTVHLTPPAQFQDQLPDVEGKSHYRHARDVDAAFVRLCGAFGMQHERFLFYRGLGGLASPVTSRYLAITESDGALSAQLELTAPLPSGPMSATPVELPHVYVLAVKEGRGRFVYLPALRAGRTLTPTISVGKDAPPLDDMVAEVQRHMVSSLQALGLYEKEAWAMVRTWAESYFRNEGVRVLFAIPQAVTDVVLPLKVDPKPDKTVRVMIARVECVTPAQEKSVHEQIQLLASPDAAVSKRAGETLLAMGRIAEPLLKRSIACCGDAQRPDLVRALLQSFHPER